MLWMHNVHAARNSLKFETHGPGNYAMRGQTVDGRNLRIAVTFDENEMLMRNKPLREIGRPSLAGLCNHLISIAVKARVTRQLKMF
jgi:hypothetical protein